MKKTLSAIAIATVIGSTSAYATGTAVLNVEGEIQINGKTVIDATGAFVGKNTGGNGSAQIVTLADYEQADGTYYYESEDKSYKNTDTVAGSSYNYTGSREKQEEGMNNGTAYNIKLIDTWSESVNGVSTVEEYTYQYLNFDSEYNQDSGVSVGKFYLSTGTNNCTGTYVRNVIVPHQEQYQVGTSIIEVIEREVNNTCTSTTTVQAVDANGNIIDGEIPDYLKHEDDTFEDNYSGNSRELLAFGALVESYSVGSNTYNNCLISEEFTSCKGIGDVEYTIDNYDKYGNSDTVLVKLVSFTPAVATFSSARSTSASGSEFKPYTQYTHDSMLTKIANKKAAVQQKIAQNKK